MKQSILLILTSCLLFACSQHGKDRFFSDQSQAYRDTEQGQVLKLPKNLQHVEFNDNYPVPSHEKKPVSKVSLLPPGSLVSQQ